jgi:hypothetical protein
VNASIALVVVVVGIEGAVAQIRTAVVGRFDRVGS